ncbi:MAG: carboxymuconolactone decarboxylase family protein [Actinomycetales bacterium]|nr:carboxymuconolactone decarboxylase family protein [Actinomycetales bacterium]
MPATSDVIFTPVVRELVAVAAAVAGNCVPCLGHHVAAARDLGVGEEVIRQTIETADAVKRAPAREILRHAETLLAPSDPVSAQ